MDKFLHFVAENTLFTIDQKLLLAVSGGKDSVLMTHLLAEAGYSFGIAHCNFQLRGEASDLDEAFVRQLAHDLKVEFYSTRFATEQYASENHISIQMAARDLRYQWLKEIQEKFHYSYLVVGHHQTDSVETVLLNLLRGTGIAGLSGISPKRDNIVRPLLAFTGKEVEEIILQKKIVFREDVSNASTKYKRNSIRLEALPVFRKINPDLEKTFLANSKRFQTIELLVEKVIKETRELLFKEKPNGETHIAKAKLQELEPLSLFLYELFEPYGFTEAVLSDLNRDWNNGSGRHFFSSTHQIVIDRDNLILKSLKQVNQNQLLIQILPAEINWFNKNIRVYSSSCEGLDFADFNQVVDLDKVKMPLLIRPWQEGDRFRPLGMKGQKKLSDYLISLKIPVTVKNEVPVIEDGNQSIIAVLPWRIDDRFKITAKTKKVIIFEESNE